MTKTANKTKPAAAVANDPDDLKGTLKHIGGSSSDDWNDIITRQTAEAIWLKHSTPEMQEKQIRAALAALIGIRPKDELEGMMAAQLIAAHNAAMECFRRAMIGEQRLEGRRDNLAQANKLSRTFATLLEALNPASRQRPAEGHRGARSRPFRRPGGGGRRGASGGWGSREIGGATPCKANCLCTSVRDVVRGRRAGARANRRRCRTADAACMADHC